MGRTFSRGLLAALCTTVNQLERNSDLAPDDRALTWLKGMLLRRITGLEVVERPPVSREVLHETEAPAAILQPHVASNWPTLGRWMPAKMSAKVANTLWDFFGCLSARCVLSSDLSAVHRMDNLRRGERRTFYLSWPPLRVWIVGNRPYRSADHFGKLRSCGRVERCVDAHHSLCRSGAWRQAGSARLGWFRRAPAFACRARRYGTRVR